MKLTRYIIALFVLFAFCDGNVLAATNELVYSGYVTDADGTALTGAHDVTVSLYTVATDGTAVWTEAQADLTFTDGFFTVALGSDDTNPLPSFSDDLYLGLAIDGDSEMTPRNEFFGSVRALSLADTVLGSALTWTGDQTFGNVIVDDIDATTGNIDTLTSADATITNLTVTSCTGCGSGGGASIDSFDADQVATTGSTEETIYTQTVSGGTLSSNGSVLKVKAWGNVVQSPTDSQTINLKIGSTTLITVTVAQGGSTAPWIIEAEIIRVDASNVKVFAKSSLETYSLSSDVAVSSVAVALASDFDITVTGDPASGTENIVAEAIYVEHIP